MGCVNLCLWELFNAFTAGNPFFTTLLEFSIGRDLKGSKGVKGGGIVV